MKLMKLRLLLIICIAVYFELDKQLGGILPKALVSVVKYGCMYKYKVGGVSQKH